jgi:Putative inner membrane protein (DUF1819)
MLESLPTMIYSADITAGSLKLAESRAIAALLIKGASESDFRRSLVEDNILQSRSPSTSIRIGRLLRQRLAPMPAEILMLIRDGTTSLAIQATLAAAIKHSHLLGDFLDLVVREQWRKYSLSLPYTLWEEYVHSCRERDPEMPAWNESTRRKTGTVVYHILQQSGYIDGSRPPTLRPVHLSGELVKNLKEYSEHYVLRCMQVTP